MVESNFKYTHALIEKINKNSVKVVNLISEISMLIILVSAIVLFVVGNVFMGVAAVAIIAGLLVALFFSNKQIVMSNKILLNQQIKIVFNESDMVVTAVIGDKPLYTSTIDYKAIKKTEVKQDLVYIYVNKTSALIVPKSSFTSNDDCDKAIELVSNNYVI